MDARKAKIIAQLIHYLEHMDGEELKMGMEPKPVEPPVGEDVAVVGIEGKDPMEMGEEAPAMPPEDGSDLDDDELDELDKLSS